VAVDDPRVNFGFLSGKKSGLDILGIQAEDSAELEDLRVRLAQADISTFGAKGRVVLLRQERQVLDHRSPGIAWESFHTLDSVPMYGEDRRTQPPNTRALAARLCRLTSKSAGLTEDHLSDQPCTAAMKAEQEW